MPKSAYLLLGNDGVVVKCHSTDIGANAAQAPTNGASDLELLISQSYVAKREIPLDGGRVLLVLEKP